MLRKLFKGGNYSRAETICGNTVDYLQFFTIGTCEDDTKIKITLTGGALRAQRLAQGVYEKSATINGKLTWTHTSSDKAVWFGSNGFWMIGPKVWIS